MLASINWQRQTELFHKLTFPSQLCMKNERTLWFGHPGYHSGYFGGPSRGLHISLFYSGNRLYKN